MLCSHVSFLMLHHVQALIEVIVTREESPLPPPAPPEQSQAEHRGVNMAETRDTDEDEEIAKHKKTIATKVTHPFDYQNQLQFI